MDGTPPTDEAIARALGSIGGRLRSARERLGMSLADIENGTHIRRLYLEAIEAGRAADIPGEVFLKGFLRTYGNHVGLDGPALVEEYKEARTAAELPAAAPGASPRARRPLGRAAAARRTGPARPRRRPPVRRGQRRGGTGLAPIVVLVVALALAWVVHALLGHGHPSAAAARSSAASASTSRGAAGAPSSSAAAPAPPKSTPPARPTVRVATSFAQSNAGWQGTYLVTGASSLEVSFTIGNGACWIRRWVDGVLVQPDVTLQPSTTASWAAAKTLKVELGAAPAVAAITVDGQATGALPPQDVNPEWLTFQLAPAAP